MITSFRASLDEWLQTTLTADLYINATGDGAALADLAELGALRAIPGVDGLALTRARAIPTARGDVAVRAVQPGARGWGLELVGGDAGAAFAALAQGTGVIASERLLFARDLRVGDELELPSPTGSQHVPIVGAFRDFNTGEPAIVMTLERYRRDWRDNELTGIGLDLDVRQLTPLRSNPPFVRWSAARGACARAPGSKSCRSPSSIGPSG